jgi:hypothetical protein
MGPGRSLSVHKSPPLDSILTQMNPTQTLQLYRFKIHLPPSHLYLGLANNIFLVFLVKTVHAYTISPTHVTRSK